MTPDEVLASASEVVPDGAYVQAAIVIISYVIPGADDGDQGPYLGTLWDYPQGPWVHLGLLETARIQLRDQIRGLEADDD